MLEERFTPLVFKTKDLFDQLYTFLDLCNARNNNAIAQDMKRILEIPGGRNKVRQMADRCNELIFRKSRLMRRLLQIYLSNSDNRKGVIAGGMLCFMKDSGSNFVPEDLNEQVAAAYGKLRREVQDILTIDKEITPEMRIAKELKSLEIGIPGDSSLRQPWNAVIDRKEGGR